MSKNRDSYKYQELRDAAEICSLDYKKLSKNT